MKEVVWDGTEEGIPAWARDAGWERREIAAGHYPAHVVAEITGAPGSDVVCHQIYKGDTFTLADDGAVWVRCLRRSFAQCAEDSRL